ncbi:MAG: hypothetical protein HY954_04200 [Deltaproteobacteria bacterium]|nr:hypothetical protein [Deltaproteobacteria bacterium]
MDNSEKWQGSPESISYKPGKGVFLALLGISAVLVTVIAFFFWYIPTVGLGNIHPALPYVLGGILIAGSVLLLGGTAFITNAAIKGRLPFYSKWLRWLLVKFYLPLMIMAGGILKIPKIKIERVFIELNNQMVMMMGKKIRPEKLLILMPH